MRSERSSLTGSVARPCCGLGEYSREGVLRSKLDKGPMLRPSALMHWWGAAAKMIINTKEWLTSSSTQRSTSSTSRRWGNMGFSWKSESLGLESLCLVNTGSVCLRRNAGAVKDQEGGVKEVVTYSMPRSRGSTTPTSPGWR